MDGEWFAKEIVTDDTYIAVCFRVKKYVALVTVVKAGFVGGITVRLLHAPKPAAAPGVKRPMIMGLTDRVVDVVELNDVASSPTVVYTNGGTGQVVHHVMANYILFTDGEENTCDLLAEYATVIDEIVGDGIFYG